MRPPSTKHKQPTVRDSGLQAHPRRLIAYSDAKVHHTLALIAWAYNACYTINKPATAAISGGSEAARGDSSGGLVSYLTTVCAFCQVLGPIFIDKMQKMC